MNAYWAQFALSGDPNGDDDPVAWPKYKPTAADGGRRIQFDPDWKILSSFRKAECELWAEYRAQL